MVEVGEESLRLNEKEVGEPGMGWMFTRRIVGDSSLSTAKIADQRDTRVVFAQ